MPLSSDVYVFDSYLFITGICGNVKNRAFNENLIIQEQNNNQNNQDKNKDQQEQNKPQQQQPQQSQMSKENAQQILDAIQQDERDTQEKVQKALMQQQKRRKTDKEW